VYTLGELRPPSQTSLRDRAHRVRANVGLAAQAGLAAALAWFVATDLFHHPQAFFAPISAVVTLAVSVGQRLRRAFELVLGVAMGIAIADLLIFWIGTGPWQIGVVVLLAIMAAVFVGGGAPLVTQAASSAVLVATLAPPTGGIYYTRFLDALIGGVLGLFVMALLLPLNPLTVVMHAANPALDALADGLAEAATALRERNRDRAEGAIERLRGADDELHKLTDAIEAGRETVTLAPVRWRARGPLAQYVDAAGHLARALRNSRVLVRRAVTLIKDEEQIAEPLPESVADLAAAVRELRRELAAGREPVTTRDRAIRAVDHAGRAYAEGVGFSGSVIVAQIRSAANDLVRASGLSPKEADQAVLGTFKRASGAQARGEG
jgi:uncharacterized membrane protein YgaE (UPF0421/DUF939 family)